MRAQLGGFFGGAAYTNHTTRAVDMAQWRRYRRDRPMTERSTRLQHHLSQASPTLTLSLTPLAG